MDGQRLEHARAARSLSLPIEAVSLGEDVKEFCSEQKLCDLSFQGQLRQLLDAVD